MEQQRILVTGALGQIGSELTTKLQSIYGTENVIATDIKSENHLEGIYESLDVLDAQRMQELILDYKIDTVYHLAAMLSATAEKKPVKSWSLNTESLIHLLEMAKAGNLSKIFWPSSIAVFGRGTPKQNTPQETLKNPQTIYGIAKLAGEGWCEYYAKNFNVDVRSIRYPGLISWKTKPGGGTTDYAVEIFYEAIKNQKYTCFLEPDTKLPMLYMDDAVEGTLQLMQANRRNLSSPTAYNMGGLSFTPKQLAAEIKKYIPEFTIDYQPDFRMEVAKTWPESIDDSLATEDWNWQPKTDLSKLCEVMLENLTEKLGEKVS